MCQGRCAGCGRTGPVKVIRSHTAGCKKFASLFRADPVRALDPEAEYARWKDEEADAEKHAARLAQVGRTDDARAAMAERFRTKDPLED